MLLRLSVRVVKVDVGTWTIACFDTSGAADHDRHQSDRHTGIGRS